MSESGLLSWWRQEATGCYIESYFYRVRTDQEILKEDTAVTQVRHKGCLDKTGMGGGGVMEKDLGCTLEVETMEFADRFYVRLWPPHAKS